MVKPLANVIGEITVNLYGLFDSCVQELFSIFQDKK